MSPHLSQQSLSPRRIRQLPIQLANQIAAGEVIERPASVVKELVENSIDAGSSQIDIVIEKGGIQLIQVSDDGYGIAVDDLPMALSPHATSKIYSLEELNQIRSLGFRGEALASIASISRITLQSRQAGEAMGWMVNESQLEPNQPHQEPQPCAIPAGSRIAVRELFFNTPGRKRFLRTERTEFLQIEAMVRRLALSHFDIGFSLEHNGKAIFRLPAASTDEQRLQRIGLLLGKPFMKVAMQISYEAGGMVLSGWIAPSDFAIPQSDRQYFYLNGRGMRDKVISHAIRHVYQGDIPEGRSPIYLLNLQIDPGQVDVNVHPTKHEVRFRQGRMVHDFITTSLRRAFEERGMSASLDASLVDVETGELYVTPRRPSRDFPQVNETALDYPKAARARPVGTTLFRASVEERYSLIDQRYLLFVDGGQHYLSDLNTLYLRQLDEAFAQLSSGVIKQLQSQPLLFPERVDLTELNFSADGSETTEQLAPFGIDVEFQTAGTLLLRTLPQLLDGADHRQFIRSLLQQWDVSQLPQLLHRLINEHGLKAIANPSEYAAQSSGWLKRFSLKRLVALIAAEETVLLDSEVLAKLFR